MHVNLCCGCFIYFLFVYTITIKLRKYKSRSFCPSPKQPFVNVVIPRRTYHMITSCALGLSNSSYTHFYILISNTKLNMQRYMIYLKNQSHTPRDARNLLARARSLLSASQVVIRDTRVSDLRIEFDASIPDNN